MDLSAKIKTQAGNPWKRMLRWVRLTLSIGILIVGFSIAILWAWLRLQAIFGSISAEYFATMIYVAIEVGVILGLVLAIVGRGTIWITVLSVLAALGLCAFVPQFWVATYQKTSGFIGERFIAELFICFLIFSAVTFAFAAVAATLVMVYDAKSGKHYGKDSQTLPKK